MAIQEAISKKQKLNFTSEPSTLSKVSKPSEPSKPSSEGTAAAVSSTINDEMIAQSELNEIEQELFKEQLEAFVDVDLEQQLDELNRQIDLQN